MTEAIHISMSEEDSLKKNIWNKSIFVGVLPEAKSVFLDRKCDSKKWFKSLDAEFLNIPENKSAGKRGCVNLKKKAGLNYQNFLNNQVYHCKGENSTKCNSNHKFYPSFECENSDGKINKENYLCSRKTSAASTSLAKNDASLKDLVKFDIDSRFLRTNKISSRSKSVDFAAISRISSFKATFDNFDLSESAVTNSKETPIDFRDFASFCLRQHFLKEKLLHERGLNDHKNFIGRDTINTSSSSSLDQKAPKSLKTEEQMVVFSPNEKIKDISEKCDHSNLFTSKGSIWLQSFSWNKESNLKQDPFLSEERNDCIREKFQLGGFAEKAYRLIKHEKSAVVLWHHDKHLKINEGPEKCSTFKIHSYFHFHHLVAMSCTILENSKSDNQKPSQRIKSNFEQVKINKDSEINIFGQDVESHHIWENCFDAKDFPVEKLENRIDYFVIVKLKVFQSLKLKPGSCVIIYPPWQTLFIKSLCVPVLLCTHFVDVLQQIP